MRYPDEKILPDDFILRQGGGVLVNGLSYAVADEEITVAELKQRFFEAGERKVTIESCNDARFMTEEELVQTYAPDEDGIPTRGFEDFEIAAPDKNLSLG